MFRFFTRRTKRRKSSGSRRAHLSLEHLETRDCPAPPQITLNMTILDHHMVRLSGTVIDESPATVVILFSGVVSDQAAPDPSGNYSVDVEASALGEIYAQGVDEEMLGSNISQVTLSNQAPVISDFQASQQDGNYWEFRGRVTDEHHTGLTVRLGGLPSLANVRVTVDESGWFAIGVQLQPGEGGTATARLTDWWGLDSDLVMTGIFP